MSKLFISHSSKDDAVVRELQQALGNFGQDVWIDSRQLRGGDPLWSEIQKGIEEAGAYAVLVSTNSLQSKWVGKELRHALEVQKERGNPAYQVIPLSLDDTKLGVLEEFFDEEPIYIPVSSQAGGIEAALHAILVALGKRLPSDVPPTPQPKAEPLEELVLKLTDLRFQKQDGVSRATARARLVYEAATPGQREVQSEQSWRLTAPMGPIEAEELRWYLEKFAVWPSEYFRERAEKVEANLIEWGKLLYQVAMPLEYTAKVLQAWAGIESQAGRRFSVYLDNELEAGAPDEESQQAQEAATSLLSLPWELLHDDDSFLFQGAKPTRVRRRLPNTRVLDVPVVTPPIRILLVTARPEDKACGYLDHRVSALPLVEAMEQLGGLVRLKVLRPPTLAALGEELELARNVRKPYHVVHFDGHGVYDRRVGLGGLCFEEPRDIEKLTQRRHATVYTNELGPLLKDHRIPLVFLEACQTAQAEQASESVASELLKLGVASVVAMSHSVLVETARRFVQAFYGALAEGKRVGDAMLAGQRRLKDDDFRGRIFGAGELRLEDWFVPVLFQEKDDPQLFTTTPAPQTKEDLQTALKARLGELPDPPQTGFVGRSRDLLALERLLSKERYAVVRGQGGEGKTALAAELARWQVRSQQIQRAAFVSVETHGHLDAVLDALGRQLVPNYSVATFENREQAILPIERALAEQSTLLVIDNMESILLPPFLQAQTPEALSEEHQLELDEILRLCARLQHKGDTRLVFTSREALPAPFEGQRNRRELQRLDKEDAVKLVERVLNAAQADGASAPNEDREAIEQLVEAVQGHARTLALLAPFLRSRGVTATRRSLVALMGEMEQRFPGSREQSVFASVELSLQRLSPANRERARVLGVFHGGVQLGVLRMMMQWEEADSNALAAELIDTGLASPNPYNHFDLNPALCPYLRGQLQENEREELMVRWDRAMGQHVAFLVQLSNQNAGLAVTLTRLELPNLFALLERVQQAGDAATTIGLANSLFRLLQFAGRPRLLARVAKARDAAAAALGAQWSHASFEVKLNRIEQQHESGELQRALGGAQALLERVQAAGRTAYPGADYDLAVANFTFANVLKTTGAAQLALPLLEEAQLGFEAIVDERDDKGAEAMVSACLSERGVCLQDLGRYDEAAVAYIERIRQGEQQGNERGVALGKGRLGTVRLYQKRYSEALAAYAEARERFTQLGEPGTAAGFWHQTGSTYQEMGEAEAAEDACRHALTIQVQLGDLVGQARSLLQLGNLYNELLDRPEEAVTFYRQAADKYIQIGDTAGEGRAKENLSETLRRLRRLDEARQEIRRAIECLAPYGHASQPWTAWTILSGIEADAGNPAAAAEARQQALAAYLAYRRDGGENHSQSGRVALAVTQALLAGETSAADEQLQQYAAYPETPDWFQPFIQALQAIVAGSRDRRLAEAPELDYSMAAEILMLIETLENA